MATMEKLSLPEAWTQRMKALLGMEFAAFLDALHLPPPVSLRLNPDKPGAEFPQSSPIPWNSHGHFLPERPRFVLDPLIHGGGYYVQEAASMLIGKAVPDSEEPPRRVLDLCAAPGGKSTLLASILPKDCLLVSNEIVGQRARILEENVSRWGYANSVVTRNRPQDFSDLPHFFDRIYVDAPCSGEGMFRKDPATIQHWSPKLVEQCVQMQREILRAADRALRPGGILVYSTCTYNTLENEDNVQWALEELGYEVVPMGFPEIWGTIPGLSEGRDPSVAEARRCYPHKFSGEGFFVVCLRKQGEGGVARGSGDSPPTQGAKAWRPLIQEHLGGEYVPHAERGEAWPAELAGEMQRVVEATRALKAGTRMGELKRGDFQPDHDLALASDLAERVPRVELNFEEALRYLKREPLSNAETSHRGWAVASHKGVGLGWVKVLDNRINSRLPKQWKIRMDLPEF